MLFRSARLLRWHKEERKKDGKLRHPADGSHWREIEREFSDFAGDARNLWFGQSTDGMNPFGEQSCSHSTWPVTLCIYNLPPWLCMKRKFIMMPVLIQGPKQPGNDIDAGALAGATKPWRREPPSLARCSALARAGALAKVTKPW